MHFKHRQRRKHINVKHPTVNYQVSTQTTLTPSIERDAREKSETQIILHDEKSRAKPDDGEKRRL